MSSRSISIIAPTYNEVNNVVPFAERVRTALGDHDWELLFVDDNSADGTAQKAFEYGKVEARVRPIIRFTDRGLAKSSIQGLLSAKGDILCVMDADGQHDPDVVIEMVKRMDRDGLDIVSAARRLNDDQKMEGLSPLRCRLSKIGNALSSFVIGRKLSDPLTGFFLIRRERFLKIVPELGDPGCPTSAPMRQTWLN